MTFVKRNVLDTGLATGIFDAVIAVSTIEHVGLHEYTQSIMNDYGDVCAIQELYRILKPQGILLLTTPYMVGKEPEILLGRIYNRHRLQELISSFKIVKEEYFYPTRQGRIISWVKMDRDQIDLQSFSEPGLACLILQPRINGEAFV
jgi:SAM-dependent methyltransferase